MRSRRTGFTLIELLVVIAIIAVLAAILFPLMASSKEKGRAASCSNNLKQITMAIQQYCDDNDGVMPPVFPTGHFRRDWGGCLGASANYDTDVTQGAIFRYTRKASMYTCPTNPKQPLSYAMNMFMGVVDYSGDAWQRYRLKLEQQSAGRTGKILLLIHDEHHNDGYFAWNNTWDAPTDLHVDGTTASYADGHVRCVPAKRLEAERDRGDWCSNYAYYNWWLPSNQNH